jgi:hypothetical protein
MRRRKPEQKFNTSGGKLVERRNGKPPRKRRIDMEFEANVVTVDEGPPIVVGFADNPSKPNNYILLSYDPTEIAQGIYMEINDQMQGGYNLVQRIRFTSDAAFFELTPRGVQMLKTDSRIALNISPQVIDWVSLKTKLAQQLSRVVPVEN